MKERLVHRGRRADLVEVEVTDPSGRTVTREYMKHPGSVVVLPLLDQDTAVCIRNHRVSVGRRLLELVAGTQEPPEPALECAKRELAEEAGYVAEHWQRLGAFYVAPGVTDERMVAYVARGLRSVGQSLDAGEDIEVVTCGLGELRSLALTGVLQDSKTVTTLALYEWSASLGG